MADQLSLVPGDVDALSLFDPPAPAVKTKLAAVPPPRCPACHGRLDDVSPRCTCALQPEGPAEAGALFTRPTSADVPPGGCIDCNAPAPADRDAWNRDEWRVTSDGNLCGACDLAAAPWPGCTCDPDPDCAPCPGPHPLKGGAFGLGCSACDCSTGCACHDAAPPARARCTGCPWNAENADACPGYRGLACGYQAPPSPPVDEATADEAACDDCGIALRFGCDCAELDEDEPLGPDGWPTCAVCGASAELQLPDGRWLCQRHWDDEHQDHDDPPVSLRATPPEELSRVARLALYGTADLAAIDIAPF